MAEDETVYDFPKSLLEAQDELDEVRGELRKLLKKQPWSVEPLPAWTTHENAWRASSHPDSPGWDSADQQRIGKLRAREVELAPLITGHSFWKDIAPEERTPARDQLKHHRERTTAVAAKHLLPHVAVGPGRNQAPGSGRGGQPWPARHFTAPSAYRPGR
ncbi:hypothetical protein ABZT48_37580 [Streptomyces avermitilis]|uniref:hypothetical protein n=1 Tax=Streptomyces avermitilis TaxID=33903 RepID=UPI0033BC182A